MNYNGSYFVEVAMYHERNGRKTKDKVGLLSRKGTGWAMTLDEDEAHEFKDLDSAKAVRAAWQREFPDHLVGVIGERQEGLSFRFREPGYDHPPSIIDEQGQFLYHRSEIERTPHIHTETCIWCGEEIEAEQLDKHEEECVE